MEIRQVLKSSASMTPVLFYKVNDGQTKAGVEERYREGEAGIAEEVTRSMKVEQGGYLSKKSTIFMLWIHQGEGNQEENSERESKDKSRRGGMEV